MPVSQAAVFSPQASLQPMHDPRLQHLLPSPCSLQQLLSLPRQASSGLLWALLIARMMTCSSARGTRKRQTFLRLPQARRPSLTSSASPGRQDTRRVLPCPWAFPSSSSALAPGFMLPSLSSIFSLPLLPGLSETWPVALFLFYQ